MKETPSNHPGGAALPMLRETEAQALGLYTLGTSLPCFAPAAELSPQALCLAVFNGEVISQRCLKLP